MLHGRRKSLICGKLTSEISFPINILNHEIDARHFNPHNTMILITYIGANREIGIDQLYSIMRYVTLQQSIIRLIIALAPNDLLIRDNY